MKKISEPNYRVEFKFWKCIIYIYSESFFFFIYDSKIKISFHIRSKHGALGEAKMLRVPATVLQH